MRDFFEKIKLYQYYILIAVMSLVCLFIMPFMGSAIGLQFKVPNTTAGWVVFIVCNLATATLSLMIFHCFVKQAKVNIKDNPKFIEAQEILSLSRQKQYDPKGPKKFLREQYTIKGATLFVSSLCAMIGLSNAIMRFDLAILLSFITVVIGAIVFGIIEMNVVEDYWTDEFWLYAKKIEKEELSEEKKDD